MEPSHDPEQSHDSEQSNDPEQSHDIGIDDNSRKIINHKKAAIIKMLTENILSNQPQLQETEVHDKLQPVVDAVFAANDVIEVLSSPNRPTLSSELRNKKEEQAKLIQQYEQELSEWEEAVEEVVKDCDQKLKSQEIGQSDKSIDKAAATMILGEDASLLDDPMINTINVDHVRQKLETLDSTVEEGLKQMAGVQDQVMKKTEQYVDQLTIAHQLPLPTQIPRTTIVQLKQIPNINDTFYHN